MTTPTEALTRAWGDLPAQLQAHPGIKALHRAALAQSTHPADASKSVARIDMAQPDYVPDAITDLVFNALTAPECHRLREWAAIGPVQRAEVESFAELVQPSAPSAEPAAKWCAVHQHYKPCEHTAPAPLPAALLVRDIANDLPASVAELKSMQFERMRHIANEWADMATNGLQWLRNIKDGISTSADALENMEACMAHCRQVNDAPGLYGVGTAPQAAASVAGMVPAAQNDWRKLALQFDQQRMSALWHLRALLQDPEAHATAAREFLAAPPAASVPTVQPLTEAAPEPTSCLACDGDGRMPSPEVCSRCGITGCWTIDCEACGGSGITAAPTKEAP